jgi:hypothetical protein
MKPKDVPTALKTHEDYRGMELRYLVDQRTIQRRVRDGLLPKPRFYGSRFPRWLISELDANDRRLAFSRTPDTGALAAAAKRAGKPAKKPAKKKPTKKPPAHKPARKPAVPAQDIA